MATLYVIPNWNVDFENWRSRTIERTSFFCVQNHFDGKKIRRLGKHSDALTLYGAFHAICAIASKCDRRGVLLDKDGPIGALELSDKTIFQAEPLAKALEILSRPDVGLIERYEIRRDANGGWELPDNVQRYYPDANNRRASRSADNHRSGGNSSGKVTPKAEEIPPNHNEHPPSGDLSGEPSKKGREGKEEKGKKPPTVPQGGRVEEDSPEFSDPVQHAEAELALGELARDVFREKKWRPNQWQFRWRQALTEQLPMERDAFESVLWFYRLEKKHPARLHPIGKFRASFQALIENLGPEAQKVGRIKDELGDALEAEAQLAEELKPRPSPKNWPGIYRRLFPEAPPPPQNFYNLDPDERQAVMEAAAV